MSSSPKCSRLSDQNVERSAVTSTRVQLSPLDYVNTALRTVRKKLAFSLWNIEHPFQQLVPKHRQLCTSFVGDKIHTYKSCHLEM